MLERSVNRPLPAPSRLQVSLQSATPCVHIFPATMALAKNFAGYAAFARLIGDTSDETRELLEELNIVEVSADGAPVGCHGAFTGVVLRDRGSPPGRSASAIGTGLQQTVALLGRHKAGEDRCYMHTNVLHMFCMS